MQLFINCTEVIALDLSNNMLTKLDIRNNAFSNVKNKHIKKFFTILV